MEYEYLVRGRHIRIEELDNLVAVKLMVRNMPPPDISHSFGDIVRLQQLVPAQSDWAVFARVGWAFVRPGPAVLQALATGTVPAGAQSVQRVYLDANGRLCLGLDRLTVRLAENITDQEALAILDTSSLQIVRRLGFARNLFQVRVWPATRHFLAAAAAFSGDSRFQYAEPEFIEYMPGRFKPTDTGFADQWHLANTGQQDVNERIGPGTAGADISAEVAWDTTRGSGVRVAIVDHGFHLSHPDLPGVTPTSGYFSYTPDYSDVVFTQGTAGYPPGDHGTLCAGMAVARDGTGVGGCGIAHLADFMAISCANDELSTQTTLARAISHAAFPTLEIPDANPNDGADVISCSLGSPPWQAWSMATVLKDAIDSAVSCGRGGKGTPIFWATNDAPVSIGDDDVCSYPNTIAVGTSNRLDEKGYSAYGAELDFLATGVWAFSTSIYGTFRPVTGTSFAAPLAAGVAALMLSACPTLTWQQVRQIMQDTCKKIGGVTYDAEGHHDDYGYGRINAAAAVQQAAALHVASSPTPVEPGPPSGKTGFLAKLIATWRSLVSRWLHKV